MKITMSFSIEHDMAAALKKECSQLGITFSSYATEAVRRFPPRNYVIEKFGGLNDGLGSESTTPVSYKAHEAAE